MTLCVCIIVKNLIEKVITHKLNILIYIPHSPPTPQLKKLFNHKYVKKYVDFNEVPY